jgi:hypothetical protein
MSRGKLLVLSVIAICLTGITSVTAQSRVATTNYQSRVLEGFDDPAESRWIVRGSKFATEGYPEFGWVPSHPEALQTLTDRAPEEMRSLGVHGRFDRLGYNYMEFIPVEAEDDDEGNPVPRGVPIPGRIVSFDMWAWGSNYDYYLEIQLQDYRGIVHTLRLGDLRYRGWRNLRVDIPPYIPQDIVYVPQRQGLELVKIVMWTRPDEVVGDFYLYLDEIKVFTDIYDEPFDGDELARPDSLEEIWSSAEGRTSPGSTGGE